MADDGPVSPAIHFGGSGVGTGGKPPGVIVEGAWSAGGDFLESTEDGSVAAVTVTNTARRVYATLSCADGSPRAVGVREDGPPLDREWCGKDCAEDAERGAAVLVGERREYEITRRADAEMHELTFEVEAAGVRLHALRFE